MKKGEEKIEEEKFSPVYVIMIFSKTENVSTNIFEHCHIHGNARLLMWTIRWQGLSKNLLRNIFVYSVSKPCYSMSMKINRTNICSCPCFTKRSHLQSEAICTVNVHLQMYCSIHYPCQSFRLHLQIQVVKKSLKYASFENGLFYFVGFAEGTWTSQKTWPHLHKCVEAFG